jgi:hypothetical protein
MKRTPAELRVEVDQRGGAMRRPLTKITITQRLNIELTPDEAIDVLAACKAAGQNRGIQDDDDVAAWLAASPEEVWALLGKSVLKEEE